MKKIMSLLLALTLCMGLSIPAFAAKSSTNAAPRMRNSDFSSTPPFGTSAFDYTTYIGTQYGNVKMETLVCNAATGVLSGVITGGVSNFFNAGTAQLVAGIIGSGVIGATGATIKSLAMEYAPNSDVVGYVMHTYKHPASPPLESYYQYTIVYYPSRVSSGQPRPEGGTFPITFYEYNWFS